VSIIHIRGLNMLRVDETYRPNNGEASLSVCW
jgi:hypothetical protein